MEIWKFVIFGIISVVLLSVFLKAIGIAVVMLGPDWIVY